MTGGGGGGVKGNAGREVADGSEWLKPIVGLETRGGINGSIGGVIALGGKGYEKLAAGTCNPGKKGSGRVAQDGGGTQEGESNTPVGRVPLYGDVGSKR